MPASDATYGAPRIWKDLREEAGHAVGQKRVARLMRAAGLVGVSRRRSVRTTRRGAVETPAADLVGRDFTATAPNQLWVADITYVPSWAGFLYLAIVLDVFSRRIVGWAMATHLRTELVLAALHMAVSQRRPQGVIHHADRGCQYTALAFGQRCQEMGVQPSRGAVGSAYDNAMAESFFATLECELIDRRCFRIQAEARMAIFRYLEGWTTPTAGTPHSASGPRWFEMAGKGGSFAHEVCRSIGRGYLADYRSVVALGGRLERVDAGFTGSLVLLRGFDWKDLVGFLGPIGGVASAALSFVDAVESCRRGG